MIGPPDVLTDKLIAVHRATRFDRVQALADWGGLPADQVTESVTLFGEQIVPAVRDSLS